MLFNILLVGEDNQQNPSVSQVDQQNAYVGNKRVQSTPHMWMSGQLCSHDLVTTLV